ncbi:mitochondrial fission regulator 1-like [Diadema setosum]|uniref:mitochondrial fission regulator 1-like n=1 Tax=Diadema setosum TaxID=31175 RepID=UPI003B3A44E8
MLDAALVHVIRMVLQLLRLADEPQEVTMGSSQCQKRQKRRRRSLVRAIGSRLPLAPIHRVHFQIVRRSEPPPWLHRQPQFYEEDCAPVRIPSLSDLPWLLMATPDKEIRSRSECRTIGRKKRRKTIAVRPLNHTPPRHSSSPQTPMSRHNSLPSSPNSSFAATPTVRGVDLSETSPTKVDDPVAMKKISALEDELEKLRAQIAMIVTLQSTSADSGFSTPASRMSLAPVMATPPPPPPPPFPAGAPPPPPPPCGAPPPPPPPPPPVSTPKLNAIELIKQNRDKNKNKPKAQAGSGMPNMADVLKGLGTVKLKSVARSPGGTPIRQPPRQTDHTDPASIIARALKKKFAQARLSCSPTANKENMGSPSSKSSPAKHNSPIKFGPHLLKPTNRAKPNIRQPRPLADVNA